MVLAFAPGKSVNSDKFWLERVATKLVVVGVVVAQLSLDYSKNF